MPFAAKNSSNYRLIFLGVALCAFVQLSSFEVLAAPAVDPESNIDEGSCSEVDFRSSLPPVRNQGDSGWCFAFSSADLVSQREGFAVSAVDIATSFLFGDHKVLDRNSSPQVQVYLQAHRGFARELFQMRTLEPQNYSKTQIFTKTGLFNTGGDESIALMMMNIQGLCTERAYPSDIDQLLSHDLPLIEQKWENLVQAAGHEPLYRGPMGAILDPVARFKAGLFQTFVNDSCRTRVSPSQPIIPHEVRAGFSIDEVQQKIQMGTTSWPKLRRVMMREVNRQLDQGRAVAIGHSAFDLIIPDPNQIRSQSSPPRPGHQDLGDHSSMIVARSKVGGKCRYFVRNAWGEDCNDYRPELKSSCEASAGGVWVPQEALRTLYSVVSIR